MKKSEIQVSREHYEENYEDFQRFVSYFNQINIVKSLRPKNILEVGVGSGFLSSYLKNKGYDIKTADFDRSLNPDIVCDIRSIPVKKESYDLVVAFEVLEHLPYAESLKALRELKRISKKYVVISIPRSCSYFGFSFMFGLPIFHKILSFGLRIPFFWVKAGYGNKQHYWELGRKGYSIKRLIRDLRKIGFDIKKRGHARFNTQHYFIVLEK